ncbi:MAG: UDP-N-acetylmuramate dehydrogenase [Sphaerochaetaceae bacterium]|nr:UDP-N-acetylmuramate dehydrogenase [Sphaerochaetaceae bacterium]
MEFNVGLYSEKINILTNERLSRYSYLHCGGEAEILAFPKNNEELALLVKEAKRTSTPITVLGGTTNTLISDKKIEGLVISTKNLKGITIMGSLLVAHAGEKLDNVIDKAIEHNLKGLEKLGGIPGTVGGAVFGNAGANGISAGDFCFYVDYLNKDGDIRRMPHYSDTFSYRKSLFTQDDVVIRAAFRLIPSLNTKESKLEKENYQKIRVETGQFKYPSLGCFFKNPEGESAGKILDELGAKGMRVGGAMVSEFNANVLINTGNATSQDFYELSQQLIDLVKEKKGIDLEYEIRLLGEF